MCREEEWVRPKRHKYPRTSGNAVEKLQTGLFCATTLHPPAAKIEQFSRLYNFFPLFPHLKNVFFNLSMSALAVRMTNRSKVPEEGGGGEILGVGSLEKV